MSDESVQSSPQTDVLALPGVMPPPQEQQQIPASTTLAPPLTPPSLVSGTGGESQFNTPTPSGTAPSTVQLPPRPIGTGVASQPRSKAEWFRQMLGEFMYSVGKGLSERGTGPMADSRGAGIAMTTPHDLEIQQQQLEIQRQNAQGLAAYHAAQAETLRNRYGPRTIIDEQGNPQQLSADEFAKLMAARAANKTKENVANITAANRLDVEKIKAMIQAGQVSKILPATGPDGKPAMEAFNKFGKSMGFLEGALPPAAYLPKSTSTIEYKELADGSIVALPKTSVQSGAGAIAGGIKGGQSAGGTAGSSRVVPGIQGKNALNMVIGTDSQGRQVAGTPQELAQAGVKNFVKAPAVKQDQIQTARSLTQSGGLFDMVEADLKAFTPEELNGIGNRIQELRGKNWIAQLLMGGADDRYIRLRTHLDGLTSTALMQAHVGSRGGERIMEHFEDLAAAKKMALGNLLSAVKAERDYVDERAMRPQATGGGKLTETEAMDYLRKAGGDANKARVMAKKDGRTF